MKHSLNGGLIIHKVTITMKVILTFLATILFLVVIASCSTSVDTNNFVPDSEIEIINGSAADISDTYSDSLFAHPFTIHDLSRDSDILNIDVTYSGGEGGCPTHLFVVNWDEIVREDENGSPFVELGLAHFLPTVENCEALVDERLDIDLVNLLGDELKDNLGFTVTNLVDSTKISLTP